MTPRRRRGPAPRTLVGARAEAGLRIAWGCRAGRKSVRKGSPRTGRGMPRRGRRVPPPPPVPTISAGRRRIAEAFAARQAGEPRPVPCRVRITTLHCARGPCAPSASDTSDTEETHRRKEAESCACSSKVRGTGTTSSHGMAPAVPSGIQPGEHPLPTLENAGYDCPHDNRASYATERVNRRRAFRPGSRGGRRAGASHPHAPQQPLSHGGVRARR